VVALGADLLTVVAHKLSAPKGIGALHVRRGIRLRPLIAGCGLEHGLRAGTENVAAAIGFGEAAGLPLRPGRTLQCAHRHRAAENLTQRSRPPEPRTASPW